MTSSQRICHHSCVIVYGIIFDFSFHWLWIHMTRTDSDPATKYERETNNCFHLELKLYWCICFWPKYGMNWQTTLNWHPYSEKPIALMGTRGTLNQNDVWLLKFTGTHQTHFIIAILFYLISMPSKNDSVTWNGFNNTTTKNGFKKQHFDN